MASMPSRWAPHPLASTTSANWWRILRRYGGQVDRTGLMRSLGISATTTVGAPLRLFERLRYGRAVARQPLEPAPVFILGHWRSGTTNLHNLFLQDEQFGHVSLLHCLLPNAPFTLGRRLSGLLNRVVPSTRPMDAVPTGLQAPMSEDFLMVGRSDLTHYLGYFFPQRLEETFRRTVLFEGVREEEIDRWKRDYLWLLRLIARDNGGRRLVLKNPPHTGRIRHVLEMFPEARFVHVYRDPFRVYASTCRLMDKFVEMFGLQRYDRAALRDAVLRRHRLLFERYFRDRDLIPADNLVEFPHEEIVADPVTAMERIYAKLRIAGFESVRPRLERYAESIAGYETNRYTFDAETIERIEAELGFLIDGWNYDRPEAAEAEQEPVVVS